MKKIIIMMMAWVLLLGMAQATSVVPPPTVPFQNLPPATGMGNPLQPLADVIQPINNWAKQACNFASQFQSLKFVCTASSLIDSVTRQANNFTSNMTDFLGGLGMDVIDGMMGQIGSMLGSGEMDTMLQSVQSAIDSGPSQLKKVLRQAVGNAQTSAIRELFAKNPDLPDNASENLVKIQRALNPDVAKAAIETIQDQGTVMRHEGESMGVISESKAGIEALKSDTGAQDLNTLINGNGTPANQGIAQRVRDNATQATSSRAALQVIAEGVGDLLSEQAVANTNVVNAVTAVAISTSQTTAEVGVLVSLETKKANDQIQIKLEAQNQFMKEVWSQIEKDHTAMQHSVDNLTDVVQGSLP